MSEIGFSFTVFLILVRLVLLIDLSLIESEEYLLNDVDGEGDRSIDLQVCWCVFFNVLPDDLIVYVKARGVLMQGSCALTQDWTFEVQD